MMRLNSPGRLGTLLDVSRLFAAGSLKFIREHAPKGSAEAFTAAELADMNRRRVSKEKFSPYD